MIMKNATLSTCRKYRYTLWRRWDDVRELLYVMFIGLNPSTADEKNDDPTIRRCVRYAQDWGYSALCMTNLFAFRATAPEAMKATKNPIGPKNDHFLLDVSKGTDVIIAAWGVHGTYLERDEEVKKLIPRLSVLKLTKNGHPAHPLYLRKDLKPVLWKTT